MTNAPPQAAELMRQWAPIPISATLELLSPDFRSPAVRAHAVSVLRGHDDEELLYYLLQVRTSSIRHQFVIHL